MIIPEPDAAKNVMVKVDKKSKNVTNVKEKEWSSKCIKWAQECINKSKNIVTNVPVKVKSSPKPANANHAMARKSYKRRKPSKSQSKKVHQTIIQSQCLVKAMRSLTLWLVT